MEYEIIFARPDDEEEVRGLLLDNDMDISGDINDHIMLKTKDQVHAAGKLALTQDKHYHLEVIGVRKDLHGQGWGSLLLNALTAVPWKYCRAETTPPTGAYLVTLMARDTADAFYTRHGFKPCPASRLADPYVEKCAVCPDRETCGPTPMAFVGGE